ncbi:hypothetical protein PR048_006633 [Dryococelus australis]|uniref:Uncharacterized protein n=1 Tax=Dryococelus australis TaxID=614101 RepID=A0ABQ9IDQ6_9NEOP|nr:hypothetical protein PR048_006633 [Dryococelus australis]
MCSSLHASWAVDVASIKASYYILKGQEVFPRKLKVKNAGRFGVGMKVRGEREIPDKTHRPKASSGENSVTRPGIEPGSTWWEASVLIAQPPGYTKGGSHGPKRWPWLPNPSLPQRIPPCMDSLPCRRKGLSPETHLAPVPTLAVHLILSNRAGALKTTLSGFRKPMNDALVHRPGISVGRLMFHNPALSGGFYSPCTIELVGKIANGHICEARFPKYSCQIISHYIHEGSMGQCLTAQVFTLVGIEQLRNAMVGESLVSGENSVASGNVRRVSYLSVLQPLFANIHKHNQKRFPDVHHRTRTAQHENRKERMMWRYVFLLFLWLLRSWGSPGGVVVRLLASHQGEPGSIPGRATPGSSHVGIVPDDAAGRRVFSRISRFPPPFISVLLHTHLASPSSALRTSMLRAAQISVLHNRPFTVSMEQRQNGRVGGSRRSRENPPASGIVRHDPHMRKSVSDPAGDRTRFALLGGERANRSATAAPTLLDACHSLSPSKYTHKAGRVFFSSSDQHQGKIAEWVFPITANRSTRTASGTVFKLRPQHFLVRSNRNVLRNNTQIGAGFTARRLAFPPSSLKPAILANLRYSDFTSLKPLPGYPIMGNEHF